MLRNRSALLVLCISALAAGSSAPARAQAERSAEERAADAVVGMVFDRPSAEAARTPRDRDDDARVDRWLGHFAQMTAGRPVLQAAYHRRLIDRALAQRGGEMDALRRVLGLRRDQPRHRWCAPAELVGYYERAYDAAGRDRDARAPLVEPYIELRLAEAQRLERRWEVDAAIAHQREALSAARANRSPYQTVLEDYGRTLETLRREALRLDQLRAQAAAGNAPAARSLALRLACERSDPAAAADAAEQAGDDDLAQVMRYAALPAPELEPLQALAVAEMFRSAADDPALTLDRARYFALTEATFYYHHFLFLYQYRDVTRLRVITTAEALPERIASLRPQPIRRPPGQWRTLTNNIAEPRVGNNGNLLRGNHLRVRNNTVYAHRSAFSVPATVDDSYDFRMVITLTHANERRGMSLYFPIGGTGAVLNLGDGGDNGSHLERLDVPLDLPNNFRFPEDTPVPLELAVHRKPGGRVHLVVTLAGRELLDWTGPIRAVATDNNRPPRSHGNTFSIGAGTTYEFTQIEVRRAGEE